ncbi:MAG: hypothetical protein K2K23_11530, partial [Muribaculaceae bacterium]|nr:hypothetical protein [Muribaculaceae bacterium]
QFGVFSFIHQSRCPHRSFFMKKNPLDFLVIDDVPVLQIIPHCIPKRVSTFCVLTLLASDE